MSKKIISLLLSMVMALAMVGTLAVSAFAANSKDTYVTSSVRHTDARNEYTHTGFRTPSGEIHFTPKHIYYTKDGLYAEYYIYNGLDHDIRLTSVDLRIYSSQGTIADSHFNLQNKNRVIHSGHVLVETFAFKKSTNYNRGMNLRTTLSTHAHTEHVDI